MELSSMAEDLTYQIGVDMNAFLAIINVRMRDVRFV
jgi:hypothetical protein